MSRAGLTHPVAFPEARPAIRSGVQEMAVAEAASLAISRPARVTALIAAAFETIGQEPVTRDRVRGLSAAAREWLLYKVAVVFRPDLDWFEAPCSICGEVYDVRVALGDAPLKQAGPGFPVASVETSLGVRRFEAPCGWHEEAASKAPAGTEVRRIFVALCGLDDDADVAATRFAHDDLDAIEAALDDLSPDLADGAQAACPACGEETGARIEPLQFVFPRPSSILREVHDLAIAYHWREPEIMALSPHRRRSYAAIIRDGQNTARGGTGR